MKRGFIMALALMLLLGTAAGAEGAAQAALTQEEIRAQLGVWSAAAYEGEVFIEDRTDEEKPYEVEEYVSGQSGRAVTEIDWMYVYEGEELRRSVVGVTWLKPRGVIAERMVDLDGDGAEEWLVITTEDRGEYDYNPETRATLWMNVYEREESGFILADRACVSEMVDWIGDGCKLFLCRYAEKTMVFFDGTIAVDVREYDAWAMSYDSGRILAAAGISTNSSVDAELYLSIYGEADPEDDMEWQETKRVRESFQQFDGQTLLNEELKKTAKRFGVEIDGEERNGNFRPKDDQDMLLYISLRSEDEEGKPIIRIERSVPGVSVCAEGMVNLRYEPSLSGKIVGGAEAGAYFEYLGEESVDERGVVWYRVKHGGLEAWVSSKFSMLK